MFVYRLMFFLRFLEYFFAVFGGELMILTPCFVSRLFSVVCLDYSCVLADIDDFLGFFAVRFELFGDELAEMLHFF